MQCTAHLLALVLLVGSSGVEAISLRNGAKPAKDEMEGLRLSFEIKNYDYFGLTDSWSDPWADETQGIAAPADEAASQKSITKNGDPVDEVIDKLDGLFKPAFLQLGTRKCWRPSDALVQQIIETESSPLTMMDAMRTAIKTAITGAIECEKSGGDTEKKSLLIEGKPKKKEVAKKKDDDKKGDEDKEDDKKKDDDKKGDAGKEDDKKEDKKEEAEKKESDKNEEDEKAKGPAHSTMHVTFRPGNEEPNLSLLSETQGTPMLNKPRASLITTHATVGKRHWSVIVDVTITDRPKNGAGDLKESQKYLKKALNSGQLKDSLRGAIYEVTGNAPDVRHIETKSAPIKQWNVDSCEKHVANIVNAFTLHYTRAQVPMALYNECTNFMPKMSFSRDHILDSVDAFRCRRATHAFEKHWKFGKNAEPKDFQVMCMEACEAKYGIDAPLCHVTKGKQLKKQPKL